MGSYLKTGPVVIKTYQIGSKCWHFITTAQSESLRLKSTPVNFSLVLLCAQDSGSLPRGFKGGGVRSVQQSCLVVWGFSGRLRAIPKFCSLWRPPVLSWVWYCVDGQGI